MRLTLDRPLLCAFFAILLIGLVMVASASMPAAYQHHHHEFYFFIKQFIFSIVSLIAMVVVLQFPNRFWRDLGIVWLIGAFVFLVLVLVPGVGHVVNGSRRWLRLGPVALQVSEFVKLCAVMYMAGYLSRHGEAVRTTLMGVVKPLLVLGLMGVLLLMEPDFGATVVIFVTALGMMFMAGVRVRWFALLIGLAAVACVLLVFLSPYRMARLTGFLHPWATIHTTGYQLTQALIAFGRGGIFGVGLGDSLQKLSYLPEAHTDFILAIFGEELGLIGVLVLLGLFIVVVWRGLKIARAAEALGDLFKAYMAYGITFWLGMQVIVNYGVNLGLLPTKGLTLPFVSYGGTSLLIDAIALAMLLRIDIETKLKKPVSA
jgi:cell division protein FtsW